MANLFLASSFMDSYQKLEDFVGEELTGKSVAFIDTASETEERKSYVEKAADAFLDLGITVNRVDIYGDNLSEIIENTDFIYVAGGNTFYLLQELKHSGADKLIQKHIDQGKIYIGESAGSIIMSPDIHYIKHMDDISQGPDLEDYTGFHYIDNYPVPHVGNKYLNDMTKEIIQTYREKLPLHPFTDHEVILIKD